MIDPEISRSFEASRYFPRDGCLIEVVDGHPYIGHIHGDGIPENNELENGGHEDDGLHLPVAKDLDKFLDDHLFDTLQHPAHSTSPAS